MCYYNNDNYENYSFLPILFRIAFRIKLNVTLVPWLWFKIHFLRQPTFVLFYVLVPTEQTKRFHPRDLLYNSFYSRCRVVVFKFTLRIDVKITYCGVEINNIPFFIYFRLKLNNVLDVQVVQVLENVIVCILKEPTEMKC